MNPPGNSPGARDGAGAPLEHPCVCCREREHAGIPDRDLDGYVCRECAKHLRKGEAAAAASGIVGCIPDPH